MIYIYIYAHIYIIEYIVLLVKKDKYRYIITFNAIILTYTNTVYCFIIGEI